MLNKIKHKNKLLINFRKLLFVAIIALIITLLQIVIIESNIKIFDIKNSYIFIYYLSLINNFFITFALLWVVSFSKFIFRIIYYLFIVGLLIFIYYVYNYNVVINNDIISESLDNLVFASSFINAKQIVFIVISSLLLIIACELVFLFIIIKRIKLQNSNIKGFFFVFMLLLVFYTISLLPIDKFRRSAQGNLQSASINYMLYPKNFVVVGINLLLENAKLQKLLASPKYRDKILAYQQASQIKNYTLVDKQPKTIIFVFGESLNASHLTANGYKRNTTPLLLKQNNIVFIKNTVSCATLTSRAQPCMIKPFGIDDIENSSKLYADYLINTSSIRSFISIFNELGYNSTFITLGNTGNSLTLLEKEAKKTIILRNHKANEPAKTFVQMMSQYKKELKKAINDNNSDKKLIIVYLNGSHNNYDDDYDNEHEVFKPAFKNASVNNANSKADIKQVVNAYDNSIIYTDYIMNYSIEQLKASKQNSAVFFFSDHGDNLYNSKMPPHGMPYKLAPKDVKNPGAFIWFSDKWLQNINKNAAANVNKYKNKIFLHDNIFHSVLDCAGVASQYINKNNSICR
ncbi:sulfatase-like hydrolase/transferase [Rickettsiales bacterium LUAb2]